MWDTGWINRLEADIHIIVALLLFVFIGAIYCLIRWRE